MDLSPLREMPCLRRRPQLRAEHGGAGRSRPASPSCFPGHHGTAGWRPLLAVIAALPRLQSLSLFGVPVWPLFHHTGHHYHLLLVSTLNGELQPL